MKHWPLNKSYFWERAPFLRILLPLILGILCYHQSNVNNYIVYILSACSVVFFIVYAIVGLYIRRTGTIITALRFASINLLLLCTGYLIGFYQDDRNDNDWYGHSLATADAYTVIVTNTPEEKDRTRKLEVAFINAIDSNHVMPVSGEALVYVYKDYDEQAYLEGDTLILPNTFQPIKNAGNPYEFDYATFSAHHNIYHQAFASSKEILLYKPVIELPLIRRIHQSCMERLTQFIPDYRTLGMLQAILIGEKANLDPDIREAYASTGIVHIIAISGAHITVFFLAIAFLLRWIKHRKYKWIQYIAAIPFIWLYVVVAGAPSSAVRAATMFSILGVGMALNKNPNGYNQLFAAAFIMLIINPTWLYDVGFQLSFLAVLSIFIFYKPIYKLLSPTNKILRSLWATISVSIAAELLIAPVVIYYFNIFPAQFIIANIIAYFFMSVILLLGMFLLAVSSMPPIATLAGYSIVKVVTLFNIIIFKLQYLNPESFSHLSISWLELIFTYSCIAFVSYALIKKYKPALFMGLGTACILVVLLILHQWKNLHQERIVIYNVNGANHVELIRPKNYYVLCSSSKISDKSLYYATNAAHNKWGAWQEKKTLKKSLWQIKDQRLLILDKPALPNTTVSIGYILINYSIKPQELSIINQKLHPKKIIIGNNMYRKRIHKLADYATNENISLHILNRDGAFILE